MSEKDAQYADALPRRPYSDGELLLFAKHNLHFYQNDTFLHAAPYEQQEHYAELISRLPPSHQVLAVGINAPSIVPASKGDFDALMKRARYDKQTPLGVFFHGTPFRGLRTSPIVWGGIFEERERIHGQDHAHSSLTFRHEQGHRIDKILGSSIACVGGLIDPASLFHSHNPQWNAAVMQQLSFPPNRIWDMRKDHPFMRRIRADERLYPGARRLDEHLTAGNSYAETDYPSEAFAEMTTHYTSLYDIYHGDEERIDARLTQAYPVLWPAYRREMIPLIEKQALSLYGTMEHQKEETAHYEHDIAYMRGNPWQEQDCRDGLRQCELQHGLAGLKDRYAETRTRHHIYSEPVTCYYNHVRTTDRAREPYTDMSSVRGEWVPHLRSFDERTMLYRDLLAKGIDVVPEMEALRYEAALVPRFVTHMDNALMGFGGLAPAHDRRWIIEDFDRLKQQFPDDRMESLQGIERAIERVSTDTYRAYALAYRQVAHLYYGDAHRPHELAVPPAQQQQDRMDMYSEAMYRGEPGMLESIGLMQTLTDAELRYAQKTRSFHRTQDQDPRTEQARARNMFRSILRRLGEGEALREAESPSLLVTDIRRLGLAASQQRGTGRTE